MGMQILLCNIAYRVYVAGMAGEKYDALDPVGHQFPYQKVQVILQNMAGHGKGAGEGTQGAGLPRFYGRCNQKPGALGNAFCNPLSSQQIRAHRKMGAINLTGPCGNDNRRLSGNGRQILLSCHVSNISLNKYRSFSLSRCHAGTGFWHNFSQNHVPPGLDCPFY